MKTINELLYNSRTLPEKLRYEMPKRKDIKKFKNLESLIHLEDINELKSFFNQESDYVDYLIFDFKFLNNICNATDCEAEIFVLDSRENLMPLPPYKTIKQKNWYHIVGVKNDSYYDKGLPVDTSNFLYRDMFYKIVCFWHLKNAKGKVIYTVQVTHLVYLGERKFRSNIYIFTSHDTDYQTLCKESGQENSSNYDSCILLGPQSEINCDKNIKGIKVGRYMWENKAKAISQFATDYIQYSKYNKLQCHISAFCTNYSIEAQPDCRSILTLPKLCSICKNDILSAEMFEILFRNDGKENEAKVDLAYDKINEFSAWHKKIKLNSKQVDRLCSTIINEMFRGKIVKMENQKNGISYPCVCELLILRIASLYVFIDRNSNTFRESSMYEVAEFLYACKTRKQLQERIDELSVKNKEHPALAVWQKYLSKKDTMYFIWKLSLFNGFVDVGNTIEEYFNKILKDN